MRHFLRQIKDGKVKSVAIFLLKTAITVVQPFYHNTNITLPSPLIVSTNMIS